MKVTLKALPLPSNKRNRRLDKRAKIQKDNDVPSNQIKDINGNIVDKTI